MITVAELDCYNPETGEVETLRLTSGVHYVEGQHHYLPALADSFIFRQSLYGDSLLEPSAAIGIGELNAINFNKLDRFKRFGFDGREARLWRVQDERSQRGLDPDIVAYLTAPSATWSSMTFGFESPLQKLDKPLQDNAFEPVTGEQYENPEFDVETYTGGDPSLKGNTLPMVYGRCNNVSMKLLNQYLLLYGCNYDVEGEPRPVHNFLSVMAGGVRYEWQLDYGTLASFLAASVWPGRYISYLAGGMVRLGTDPRKAVTADVCSAPDQDCTVADLVGKILTDFGLGQNNYSEEDLSKLDQVCDIPAGVYVTTDASVLDVVTDLLASINAWITYDGKGVFRFGWLKEASELNDEAPLFDDDYWTTGTESLPSIGAEGGLPASSLKWEHSRNWTVTTESEIFETVSDERRKILSSQYQFTQIASPPEIHQLHLLAKPASVQTLLNPQCPIHLDNETFQAGLIRWTKTGTVNILGIGQGIMIKELSTVRQQLLLPTGISGSFSVTVTGNSNAGLFHVRVWNGSGWTNYLNQSTSGFETLVFPMVLNGVADIRVEIETVSKSTLHLRRVQIELPALFEAADLEAGRRARQAASRPLSYEFGFPMDQVLDLHCGGEIRIKDDRYELADGPTFQIIGRTENWENETIALRLLRVQP